MTAVLEAMAYALVLTVILESAFAAICGIRDKRDYLIIFLVNVMTNPAVNVIHGYCAYGRGISGAAMVIITAALEISAVMAEWLVYKSRTDISRPFLFSLGANGFSYFCGLLISILRG